MDGFYQVQYEGLTAEGTIGQGVAVLLDGSIYGGDSATCFLGSFYENNDVVVARVAVFPLSGAYQGVTGFQARPYDLTEIRSAKPLTEGELPDHVEINLDAERYDTHQAISLSLTRFLRIPQ